MRLVDGMARGGADIDLMVARRRHENTSARVSVLLPGPLGRLPYKPIAASATRLMERWYRSRIHPGEIAWLWPNVSLELQTKLAQAGVRVVLEGINTRMAHAKPLLDAAYDAFGAPPGHGITAARIAEEEEKLALADAIFTPSPLVEAALKGSPLETRIMRSSYGVDTSRRHPVIANRDTRARVTYLFCGYACVRKGVHHLLDLWPRMPADAVLRLVGKIEPVIAARYQDLLASDRVEVVGFTRDVEPHYAAADVFVFPSLEEGDPLVSYEAALHGLPAIASVAGAGRMGAEHGTATIINPADADAFTAALLALHGDGDRRQAEGARAARIVQDYDWTKVGAARIGPLYEMLEGRP
jgi:glycosyltransferase involved in cell wall biosynthesis